MIYLAVAIVCYMGTGVIQKWGATRNLDATKVNLAFRRSSVALAMVGIILVQV